jgi:hypothetical protein
MIRRNQLKNPILSEKHPHLSENELKWSGFLSKGAKSTKMERNIKEMERSLTFA